MNRVIKTVSGKHKQFIVEHLESLGYFNTLKGIIDWELSFKEFPYIIVYDDDDTIGGSSQINSSSKLCHIEDFEDLNNNLPIINFHTGELIGDEIQYGCAKLKVEWFMDSKNRYINSLTLSSGVFIEPNEMAKIRNFVEKNYKPKKSFTQEELDEAVIKAKDSIHDLYNYHDYYK